MMGLIGGSDRRRIVGWLVVLVLGAGRVSGQETGAYRSPYRVEFAAPRDALLADIEGTERGDGTLSARVPHADWYSAATRSRWNVWGPPARLYDPPEGWDERPVGWKRERVIALGMRFVGYDYQHHHVPDWDPPADWPWKETAAGRNGKGVDCSNFTSFVYNQGFGVKLSSDIDVQHGLAAGTVAALDRKVPLQRVELPGDYRERIAALRTGDLVFIRARPGDRVSHVVLWVGPIGRSAEEVPLVLDSHGSGVKDERGETIPAGVQLRPFREASWYNRSASHALRVFRDED